MARSKLPRFELTLPADLRAQLDEVAVAAHMTVAEVLRLGGSWVVHHRDLLVKGRPAPMPGE